MLGFANAAVLSLYNSRLTNGIVVSVGHNVASVAPVWRGQVLTDFVYFLESDPDEEVEANGNKGTKDKGFKESYCDGGEGEKFSLVVKRYHYDQKEQVRKEAEWEKKFMAMDWGEIVADAIRHASKGDTTMQQVWHNNILLSGGMYLNLFTSLSLSLFLSLLSPIFHLSTLPYRQDLDERI